MTKRDITNNKGAFVTQPPLSPRADNCKCCTFNTFNNAHDSWRNFSFYLSTWINHSVPNKAHTNTAECVRMRLLRLMGERDEGGRRKNFAKGWSPRKESLSFSPHLDCALQRMTRPHPTLTNTEGITAFSDVWGKPPRSLSFSVKDNAQFAGKAFCPSLSLSFSFSPFANVPE